MVKYIRNPEITLYDISGQTCFIRIELDNQRYMQVPIYLVAANSWSELRQKVRDDINRIKKVSENVMVFYKLTDCFNFAARIGVCGL